MKRFLIATLAIASLVLAGSAPAGAASIYVRHDVVNCQTVTVTAHGYGLSIDSAFQIVSGNATTLVSVTRTPSGEPTITATFTTAQVGENGSEIVRTRYGGYLAATDETTGGPAELVWFPTCR